MCTVPILYVYAAIGALAVCPHITELSTRLADNINLSAIAASFPSLESLSCPETNNFYGSREQLGRLRILRVSAWKSAVPANQTWLPLRSTETLTQLSLEYGPDLDMSSSIQNH